MYCVPFIGDRRNSRARHWLGSKEQRDLNRQALSKVPMAWLIDVHLPPFIREQPHDYDLFELHQGDGEDEETQVSDGGGVAG